jgi:hypothetical protein
MPDIEFRTTGFEDIPPFAAGLVQACGLAAINWGKLEQQLDMLLQNVNHEEYSQGNFRQTPTTSFEAKREVFKRWFVNDNRFTAMHDKAARLYRSLGNASLDRQLFIHSSVQEFIEGPPVAMKVIKISPNAKRKRITFKTPTITEDKIRNIAVKYARLTHGMAYLAHLTMNDEFRRTLEITGRQITMRTRLVRRTKRTICFLARRLVRATCQGGA